MRRLRDQAALLEAYLLMASGWYCVRMAPIKWWPTVIGVYALVDLGGAPAEAQCGPRRGGGAVRTITADNGTEFHGYAAIERATHTQFYFATPHHAWERGTNENANGLIRQYLPKGQSMNHLTQHDCNRIAAKLNNRPRKRLGYRTPEECYES